MIAWCWYPGFRFTRLKERYSSNVGRSAELQIHWIVEIVEFSSTRAAALDSIIVEQAVESCGCSLVFTAVLQYRAWGGWRSGGSGPCGAYWLNRRPGAAQPTLFFPALFNLCFHIFTFDIWQETDIYKIKRIGAKWLLLTSTQHQSHCLPMHSHSLKWPGSLGLVNQLPSTWWSSTHWVAPSQN